MVWRDGLGTKNMSCFAEGPGFNSEHPFVSSQSSVTPVPLDSVATRHAHSSHTSLQVKYLQP